MLYKDPRPFLHAAQIWCLLLLSIALLPISTSIVLLSYAVQPLMTENGIRRRLQQSTDFQPKTVLVTGVGMTKGLTIARAFYQTGHRVIGADFEANSIPVSGRFSRAVARFYRVSKPSGKHGGAHYVRDLVYIIEKEGVDLWVSCSGVASAAEDGQAMEVIERRTKCKSIQFDSKTTKILQEKDSFIQHTGSLGLPTLETHQVLSRAAVHNVLNEAGKGKKQYIMRTLGADDSPRTTGVVVLPKRTPSQTYGHVSRLPISKSTPWVLQQYIKGEEYCTHAIVINGKVKLFVACPSSDLLMHYQALPQGSGLSQAMLHFTEQFANRAGSKFSGHLSFDFTVEEKVTEGSVQRNIYPLGCNPRAHTAVVLFSGTKGSIDMVKAYLSAFEPSSANGASDYSKLPPTEQDTPSVAFPHATAPGYYWIGHDIVTFLLYPLLRLLTRRIGIWQFIHHVTTLINHVLFWKDGTYEVWDPLPWWSLYHIYWPGQFWQCLRTGRKRSRIDVSTTTIFEC